MASALFQWQAALGYFVGDEEHYHRPNIQPDTLRSDQRIVRRRRSGGVSTYFETPP
jgi:hypothetical protein